MAKKNVKKKSRVSSGSRPSAAKRALKKQTPSRVVASTSALEKTQDVERQEYSAEDLMALENAGSPDQAMKILKSLNRFAATPTDEIFGDEPSWYFDGRFGTNAPVEIGEYYEKRGLNLLEVSCRDASYTLIADRSYEHGYMREMLVILAILNAELERAGRRDRAYYIIQPSWPAVLLLDDRLAVAAKILRNGKDKAMTLEELKREYDAVSKTGRDIPWVKERP